MSPRSPAPKASRPSSRNGSQENKLTLSRVTTHNANTKSWFAASHGVVVRAYFPEGLIYLATLPDDQEFVRFEKLARGVLAVDRNEV